MRYVDEFRDGEAGKRLAERIARVVDRVGPRRGPIKIMEVCGGHTHAIFQFGLPSLLPEAIELVHGPGCPVCVLPIGRVDEAIALAELPNVVFATFGDAVRVPGSNKSLLVAKAEGADVRTVYSPMDALSIARKNRDKNVIFFGLGFETTAPSTALTILEAARAGDENFSVFCNHITIPATLEALLDAPDVEVDGLIGPGHVSLVIGTRPYEPIARAHRRPFVVSGFEPLDVLLSIYLVVSQIADGRAEVENQYRRVVLPGGNPAAQAAMAEVFEPRASSEWRGLGSIPRSGLAIRPAYARFDAEQRFAAPSRSAAPATDPKACRCGEVLRGTIKPWECKVFGTSCTPETPIGACMVSSEGACAAYYGYGRLETVRGLAEDGRRRLRTLA
ncbi:MAG: hydrogenase formation protein HypD [Myxococcales bacterium]|nr:hydrogenase formation protein HypD [Myxococcales bacterium]